MRICVLSSQGSGSAQAVLPDMHGTCRCVTMLADLWRAPDPSNVAGCATVRHILDLSLKSEEYQSASCM